MRKVLLVVTKPTGEQHEVELKKFTKLATLDFLKWAKEAHGMRFTGKVV